MEGMLDFNNIPRLNDKYQEKWNPDISITSIEEKIRRAAIEARPKYNTSLGYVKDTYVGDISPSSISNMSQISKMKYIRLNASFAKTKNRK